MKEITSKEKILKNIRQGLTKATDQPFPDIDNTSSVYPQVEDSLDVLFAKQFSRIDGYFVYCADEQEFISNLKVLADEAGWDHLYCWEQNLQLLFQKNDFRKCRIGKSLDKANAGVSCCEALIARTGSILLSSRQASGRTLTIFPPVHIVVAYQSQLVYDIKDGIRIIKNKYKKLPSMISLASGPSRTADIEKTLVLGAHGPKAVYVFLIDQ